MSLKVFQMLEFLNTRLSNIEKNIARIDEKLDFSIALQRNHLIRVKNGDPIDDNMILMGTPYNDLTPEKAFKIFSDPDMDFILLDVSQENSAFKKIEGSIRIPLEDLDHRYAEIESKTTPLLVISENGLRSIMACEKLIKKGYLNLNNISGGHQFWPGNQENENDKSEELSEKLKIAL